MLGLALLAGCAGCAPLLPDVLVDVEVERTVCVTANTVIRMKRDAVEPPAGAQPRLEDLPRWPR